MGIFESPWALVCGSFVVLFIITCVRGAWPEKCGVWLFLFPVVIAVCAFGLDHFVMTDREKIDHAIDVGVEAISTGDMKMFGTIISPTYKDSVHLSKTRIVNYCGRILIKASIGKVKRGHETITVSSSEATAELRVKVQMKTESVYAAAGNLAFVKLNVHFIKTKDDEWLIDNTEITEINQQKVRYKSIDW